VVKDRAKQIFRRGITCVPNFSAKCESCKEEFIDTSSKQPCPSCGGDLVPPDPKELKVAQRWLKHANLNHQSLVDVMEATHPDICVIDEGYIINRKEYVYDENGNIRYSRVKEIIQASSIVMRPVVVHKTGTPGGKYWICPVCRNKGKKITRNYSPIGSTYEETTENAPKCECGKVMQDVKYVSIFHERGEIENYYIDGEVIHWNEFQKSNVFSPPPGITLWVPASILIYKSTYARDAFMKQRRPRGVLVVTTNSIDDFNNFWKEAMENVKKDWHYIPIVPVEPDIGVSGKNYINFVDLMGSMKDLEFKEIFRMFERQLEDWYGVVMSVPETSSVQGQSTRMTFNNLTIESATREYNRVLEIQSSSAGLTDWHWEVEKQEDKDLLREGQIKIQKVHTSQLMQSIGYEVEYDKHTGEMNYRKDTQKELNKATAIINILWNLKNGIIQAGGMMGGGAPPSMGASGGASTMTPKVSSSSFSGDPEDKTGEGQYDYSKGYYDPEFELKMGIAHEIEDGHTTDQEEARKIAMDHLKDIPDYYTRLHNMEEQFEMEKKYYYKNGEIVKANGSTGMHSGDTKPTHANNNVQAKGAGQQSQGYTAPDGSWWPSKQSYGGHQKTLGKSPGSGGTSAGGASGFGGGGASGPGGAPGMMNMAPPITPEDIQQYIEELREFDLVDENILRVMERTIDESTGEETGSSKHTGNKEMKHEDAKSNQW
jgi:hypothetical protein